MDDETFNMSLRKFLKTVGVNGQREIEQAIGRAISAGTLRGNETLPATMRLTVDGVALDITFEGELKLE